MNCARWEALQGMTFDHHPRQQDVTLTPIEPDHPLLKAFEGRPFVHFDEPYLFVCKYTAPDFRPLLLMDIGAMQWVEQIGPHSGPCYGAWIKRYGKGRVFYTSPSHNAQSFEDPRLLRFMLDGIQYALGDLACDDAPSPHARASRRLGADPNP
jgi:type 1 glutamine amidotransferase